MSVVTKEIISTTGCGRTDSGVHALNYFAHFDSLDSGLHKNAKFIHQINCILPKDISVYNIYSVPSTAHARFDALSRTYLYRITQIKNPFNKEFVYYHPKPLNLPKMNTACEILLEFSDFTSFSKLHSDVKTNECKIIYAGWSYHNGELQFTITADRFLRNMVRAIVGTLINIGMDNILPEKLRIILEAKNRAAAGLSVPAKGLHLTAVSYPESLIKLLPDE